MKTMIREIKFRAFEVDSGEMFAPDTSNNNGYFFSGFSEGYLKVATSLYSDDVDYVLMQYTGLKDQNGAEIYEGDICKTLFGVKGEVVFDNGSFKLKNKQDLYSIGKLPEKLGNIYENPELLSNHDSSKTQ